MTLTHEAEGRLSSEKNIWVATTRPDGRPHLTPVWFAWVGERLYICIQPGSVKARNLAANPQLALSLEDGSSVVICEGTARPVAKPWSEAVRVVFQEKYNWDILTETDYTMLVEITPQRWLIW